MQVAVNPNNLDRGQFEFADGSTGRAYDHDSLDRPVSSVTTILDERLDPDKDNAIDGWKDKYDGSKSWRAPHWREQLFFKQHRGTLVHYAVLSQFGVERGEEEDESEHVLKNWGQQRPARNDSASGEADGPIPVYGPYDEYDGEDPWDAVMRDCNWAVDAFADVQNEYDITEDTVMDAEQYVLDTEYGYAGQADLIFDPPDAPTTLADIKTGSAIREDVKYQTAAYARACEYDVDRLMCIRLYPDDQDVEVQTDDDWTNSIDGYQHHFLSLCELVNETKFPATPVEE